jgi:hypothetical protein
MSKPPRAGGSSVAHQVPVAHNTKAHVLPVAMRRHQRPTSSTVCLLPCCHFANVAVLLQLVLGVLAAVDAAGAVAGAGDERSAMFQHSAVLCCAVEETVAGLECTAVLLLWLSAVQCASRAQRCAVGEAAAAAGPEHSAASWISAWLCR